MLIVDRSQVKVGRDSVTRVGARVKVTTAMGNTLTVNKRVLAYVSVATLSVYADEDFAGRLYSADRPVLYKTCRDGRELVMFADGKLVPAPDDLRRVGLPPCKYMFKAPPGGKVETNRIFAQYVAASGVKDVLVIDTSAGYTSNAVVRYGGARVTAVNEGGLRVRTAKCQQGTIEEHLCGMRDKSAVFIDACSHFRRLLPSIRLAFSNGVDGVFAVTGSCRKVPSEERKNGKHLKLWVWYVQRVARLNGYPPPQLVHQMSQRNIYTLVFTVRAPTCEKAAFVQVPEWPGYAFTVKKTEGRTAILAEVGSKRLAQAPLARLVPSGEKRLKVK